MLPVIETNADEKPGTLSKVFENGCYTWNRTSLNEGKTILMKVKRPS